MNNMPNKKSVISLAVGSAFVAALGTASVASAGDNPFSAQSLDKGYKVAMSHDDDKGAYGDKKHGEGRCGMSMADTNNDGRVSREEHARHADMMFDRMDANKDGYIDKDEASAMKRKRQGHGHEHGHGDSYKSDRKYESGETGGVDVHRYREYGAGQTYDRDLPHMKTMGE